MIAQLSQSAPRGRPSHSRSGVRRDGFFAVKDATGAEYFTRAGAFHTDKNNNLVDSNGYFVQGYNPIQNTVTGIGFDREAVIPWIEGVNLAASTSCWIPAELVTTDATLPPPPGSRKTCLTAGGRSGPTTPRAHTGYRCT